DLEGAVWMTLSADELIAFADAGVSVTVKFPGAEVTLSPDALSDLAAMAALGADSITIAVTTVPMRELSGMQAAQVKGYETVTGIEVFAGSTKVDIPLTISLPYTLKQGENPAAVRVWYMNDSGVLTDLNGVYDAETGMITFHGAF
ncbi:MAG: hypothetical protein FWH06_06215, partial [Oscillospiraceae bacterium]|nr:hypothetical protein [Oscillospiraceae bacterium]